MTATSFSALQGPVTNGRGREFLDIGLVHSDRMSGHSGTLPSPRGLASARRQQRGVFTLTDLRLRTMDDATCAVPARHFSGTQPPKIFSGGIQTGKRTRRSRDEQWQAAAAGRLTLIYRSTRRHHGQLKQYLADASKVPDRRDGRT